MLQIIGWMGCVYLIVKGFELMAKADDRPLAKLGAGIAFFSAAVFLVMIHLQTSGNAAAEAARRYQLEDPEGYAKMANELGFEYAH